MTTSAAATKAGWIRTPGLTLWPFSPKPIPWGGACLLDKLEDAPDYFRFKHHYILHTLDSQILLRLLTAIGEKRRIRLTNASVRSAAKAIHTVYPLHIFISTQGGRQYLLCYPYGFRKMMFFRLYRHRRAKSC